MSRRRPTHQPTAVLIHPNDPSIKITVQKLTRIQQSNLAPVLAKSARAIAVEDKNGDPVLDKDGEPRIFVQNVLSLELTLARLRMAILNWEGILDVDEKPIPFSPDRVDILTEDFLDCECDELVPVKEAKEDEPKEKMVHLTALAFATWINLRLNEPKTFSTDPFVSGSATP